MGEFDTKTDPNPTFQETMQDKKKLVNDALGLIESVLPDEATKEKEKDEPEQLN